ncbi:ASCH domain-containing protein [Arthrobacter halodurans]|uniref:ASCH domain-containing protein n=1 Tax=Arthrobacter halodurans TaxID=516699 RepID=A0ABV4UJA7_9MICC
MTDQTTTLSPIDYSAAQRMWNEYAAARPEAAALCTEHTVERFGDSDALADALLLEVLHGTKRATSELADEFTARGDPLPRIGSHWVACDGSGRPRAVLRTTELRLAAFDAVDAAFARDEGEDDLSLESWRREHRKYWIRGCAARGRAWSETDPIVLERFAVVWPPEIAD